MKACVDIGGSKVAVSLCAPDSTAFVAKRSESTVKTGASDSLAQQVLHLIDAVCADAGITGDAIVAVGVASCGPFVLRDGCVELASPNLCGGLAGVARGLPNNWLTLPLEAPLRHRFERVRVENDGIAALEAERRWGALQGFHHCAYVTWSTGIGMGLCVDGHVLHGKSGNAGHAGHVFVSDDPGDALCGCGNRGDVEGLVAGNAIERRFQRTAETLMQQCRAGDPSARAIVNGLCRVLGRALYNLVVTLDLQRISLGGSVYWHHRDLLLPLLKAELHGRFPALTADCELVSAGLENRVGDYAALALVS